MRPEQIARELRLLAWQLQVGAKMLAKLAQKTRALADGIERQRQP